MDNCNIRKMVYDICVDELTSSDENYHMDINNAEAVMCPEAMHIIMSAVWKAQEQSLASVVKQFRQTGKVTVETSTTL